ncbi:hypothetical protein GCM10017083_17210 [Thalassobaculum fulvum]|uniref:DUF2783 domain-containing protein n=1 Tax=Thalassobaculum fulvum TaxID=1633335 RepID=A0A918XQF9_9PROT|nr:DUF2783 domain-containing protein [Thalassobaculum fulvum]GHD47174.1 hypothetical protein GCM10017083_17210 [Thalassobaculum fulvum]
MTTLKTDLNLTDADGFYERLIEAHRGLDGPASRRLNAKLVLLLANHVGDAAVLDEALRIARGER